MVNLHSFPFPNENEGIKIIERASKQYQAIGTHLLNDTHGIKVNNIQSKTNGNIEAMREIFCQWLQEDAQCSWKKLLQCLRKCDCKSLADEIECTLGYEQEGNFVALSFALGVEMILLSLQMVLEWLLKQVNKVGHLLL